MQLYTLLAALFLCASATAQAQSSDQLSTVALDVGLLSGATYSQASANLQAGTSDQSSPVKLGGTTVTAAATLAGFRLELDDLSAKASGGSYYSSRQDTLGTVGYRFDDFPWLVPTLGYFASAQTSDRAAATAPLEFIDKTATLALGLRGEWVPVESDGHGLELQLAYDYLTSGEAAANFGNRYDLAAGYVYKDGSFEVGVTAGVLRTYLDAVEHATQRQVRETLQSNVVKVFFRY